MASKGIFESKYGSRERGAVWQNITKNLINWEEFALTARSIWYHFTTLVKWYKSKTRQEFKGEELSENEQLLEDIIERFEENECRTKADTQKRQSYIENVK